MLYLPDVKFYDKSWRTAVLCSLHFLQLRSRAVSERMSCSHCFFSLIFLIIPSFVLSVISLFISGVVFSLLIFTGIYSFWPPMILLPQWVSVPYKLAGLSTWLSTIKSAHYFFNKYMLSFLFYLNCCKKSISTVSNIFLFLTRQLGAYAPSAPESVLRPSA